MRIKLYLADWFFNMGIVGFKRILEYSKNYKNLDLNKYNYKEIDNYVEFDSSLLENFQEYYFDYFLQKYDIYSEQDARINKSIAFCKKEDKFKDGLKVIKDIVKKNNDKIKKIDEDLYKNADEIYKNIGNLKKKEQIEELEVLCNEYKEILSEKVINERMTLNKFKSIVSNNFYGQVSYLNVNKSSRTLEEQKQIMYVDYISPILEMCKINDLIEKRDIEEIQEYISNVLKEKEVNKNIAKLFGNIEKKFIKKSKSIEEIKEYLNGDEFSNCSLCGEHKSLGNDFGEGTFVPLGVSTDNSRNMFWNFNTSYPLCDICRLIIFCSAAGSVDIYKMYMDADLGLEDKLYYAFINTDTSVSELFKTNESFNQKRGHENPFKELIFDMVSTASERSIWQLQNILYVEFNTDYSSKNCKMNYFNIPKPIAIFFKEDGELINAIKEERFKAKVVDEVLKNIDLKFTVDKKLREIISGGYGNPVDCYKAVKVKYHLKRFRGGNDMANKVDDKKLKFIYMRGLDLNKHLRDTNAENKISSIAYRLLNSTKSNNRKEFMDTLIRIHMSAEMDVPSLFLDIMTEKELAFEEISHAFISGLVSKQKNENEGDK